MAALNLWGSDSSIRFVDVSLNDLHSDHFAGDNNFHSPILLPALARVVVCDGPGLAQANCGHRVLSQTLLNEKITDGICPLLGKLHIRVITANVVGMTLDG